MESVLHLGVIRVEQTEFQAEPNSSQVQSSRAELTCLHLCLVGIWSRSIIITPVRLCSKIDKQALESRFQPNTNANKSANKTNKQEQAVQTQSKRNADKNEISKKNDKIQWISLART